jgi:hypothetical protein
MKKMMVFMFVLFLCIAGLASVHAAPGLSPSISVSLVNQDPDPALAGEIVEVRVGVENVGDNPINDLIVEFVPSYPFDVLSGEASLQKLGTIQATGGSSSQNLKIIKFKIRVDKDAIAGNYELKLKYYAEGAVAETQATLSVEVQNRDNAEIIHIDKSVLVPGAEDTLRFTINNVGNSPLRDLTFYWENSDNSILPVGSDNTKYIKYIDVGESAVLEYKVIADTNAEPGLYKLDLYLTYDDPVRNGTKTVTTIAGVYVGGGTDFDVAFSQSASGQMSFTVANIGSNPAYSVSVIVPDQQGWRVSGSSTVIIGNLNKGDYTVATFALSNMAQNRTGIQTMPRTQNQSEQFQQGQFQRSMNASGDKVRMQIAYTDTRGQRLVVEKEVKVSSDAGGTAAAAFAGRRTAQQNVFSRYKWYFIAFVVVMIGFFVYYKIRRKRILDAEVKPKKK